MTGGGRRPHTFAGAAIPVATVVAAIPVATVVAAIPVATVVAAIPVATVVAGAVGVVGVVVAAGAAVATAGVADGGYRKKGVFSGLGGLLSGMVGHAARGGCPGGGGLMAGTGWRVMRLAARLMPAAMGKRWLAEAESFLAEAPPALRCGAIASYLTSTPQVITVSWTGVLTRQARRALRGRAAPR